MISFGLSFPGLSCHAITSLRAVPYGWERLASCSER